MARLNEPPVSTDSLETLRKKLLRQNRDLAKLNNIRALRIRELENDCSCMLSESLQLRGRILELENALENSDAQRVADHALSIRERLESQLAEFSSLISSLGDEPPRKRQSTESSKKSESRLSFSSARLSPSQRRLREITKDVEELGHISEDKPLGPRNSMNPEQIFALRSMADAAESPELGPPPMSQFIDEDPVKIDSPTRQSFAELRPETSPTPKMQPPIKLSSPQKDLDIQKSPSPEKRRDVLKGEPKQPKLTLTDKACSQPIKAGSKRKFSAHEDTENARPQKITNENQSLKSLPEKPSIRDKMGEQTLKETFNTRNDTTKSVPAQGARRPLAMKSANDDVTSPKKATMPAITDEVAAAKASLIKSKASQERVKAKLKNAPVLQPQVIPLPNPAAPKMDNVDLGAPVTEPALLSPSSPDTAPSSDGGRGGTPPPMDINSQAETMRPSRRNRTAISYAEPNLRDKMRRPTKELFDAVAGEGRYARRSSQAEHLASDSAKKRESIGDSVKQLLQTASTSAQPPASPCAGKGDESPPRELPSSVTNDRRSRRMSSLIREVEAEDEEYNESADTSKADNNHADTSEASDVDVYDFQPSSPPDDLEPRKKPSRKAASRRYSSAQQDDAGFVPKERASRRRSMMV